jgi:hypothetical protein
MITLCVNPEKIDEIWPRVSYYIQDSLKRGPRENTFEGLRLKLKSGLALLWLAFDGEIHGVATTELITIDGRKLCVISSCGGKRIELWKHCIRDLEAFARDEKCCAVRIGGRPGWKKLFGDYKEPWICLEKELH